MVRLVPDPASSDGLRAWTLSTTLEELTGLDESPDAQNRRLGAFSREFGGENWLDHRNRARAYADHDPAVLVVGGGPVGSLLALYLARQGHRVQLIESRPDLRRTDVGAGRSINLALAAKAYAFIKRRGYVIPEDVRAISADVLRHRIGLTYEAEAENIGPDEIIAEILNTVEVP